MEELILQEVLKGDVEVISPLPTPGVVKASAQEAASFLSDSINSDYE